MKEEVMKVKYCSWIVKDLIEKTCNNLIQSNIMTNIGKIQLCIMKMVEHYDQYPGKKTYFKWYTVFTKLQKADTSSYM